METILPTHPQSNFNLLRRSFVLYSASFGKVFLLALLIAILCFVPRLLTYLLGQNIFVNLNAQSRFNPHLIWATILDLIALIMFIAIFWRMHCIDRGFHEPFIEDFYVGLKKIFAVVVAAFIQSAILLVVSTITMGIIIFLYQNHYLSGQISTTGFAITVILFCLQFFLLLYVSTLFIFFIPLIAIENKGVLAALQRSMKLGWNHWWRILSLQFVPWFTYLFLLLIIRYPLHVNVRIFFVENNNPITLWEIILQIFLFAFILIWAAALLLVQLRDLELRKHITETDKNAV